MADNNAAPTPPKEEENEKEEFFRTKDQPIIILFLGHKISPANITPIFPPNRDPIMLFDFRTEEVEEIYHKYTHTMEPLMVDARDMLEAYQMFKRFKRIYCS